MRCAGCGAELLLGSAQCWSCGRSVLAEAEASPSTLPPPPAPMPPPGAPSFDAPPPPPPGWTLADGAARQALLPPPPARATRSVPQRRSGCGCGIATLAAIVVGVVAAIIGGVISAVDGSRAERIDGPALALGETVRFELGARDTAVHPLSLDEGAVTITVRALDGDFDPVLVVARTDGTPVGRNDDAIGRDSQLSFAVADDAELLVEVTEFGGDRGEYEVEVSAGATGPLIDPNDVEEGERLERGRLPFDEGVDGSVGIDDTAVYTVSGVEGTISITVAGSDGFDPVVRVVDQEGHERARNDDFAGRDSFVTLEVSTTDELAVEVTEFGGDAGRFLVRLRRGDRPPEGPAAPAPLVVDGDPIERGRTVRGAVAEDHAVDHRLVTTGEGGTLAIDVEGLEGFDPTVTVLDGDGNQLGFNDDVDPGRDLDSHLEVQLPATGTVVVRVAGFGGERGDYELEVR